MVETLIAAADQIETVLLADAGLAQVVADKGYHSSETMVAFAEIGVRSYVSEPDWGRRNWKGKAAAWDAVYANRRRIRAPVGNACCGDGAKDWNGPMRICTRLGACAVCRCAAIPISSNVCSCRSAASTSGYLCGSLTGTGPLRNIQNRAAAILGALIGLLTGLWRRLMPSWDHEPLFRRIRPMATRRRVNPNT